MSLRKTVFCTTLLALSTLVYAGPHAPRRARTHDASNSEKNVVYGHNTNWQGQDESLDLDVFWPAGAAKGKHYPLVLLIHGGTFITGKKDGLDKACAALADSGFVAVTINYRLGWKIPSPKDGCDADISDMPNAVYRAQQDSRAALRFLVKNADKYFIDPAWIFVGGNSAGAITAEWLTYVDQPYADRVMAPTVKALGGLDNASNDIRASYRIKGICGMWGALPDSALVRPDNAVPAILYHGTADRIVAYDSGRWREVCPKFPMQYGSANMYRQLVRYGKPVVLNTAVGAGHGPAVFKDVAITMSNTACFFHQVMRGTAPTASYTDAVAGCR